MAHVENRLLDVAKGVPQQIDRHHGQCMPVGTVLHDVARILILRTHILTEAEGLRGKPVLLQFDKNQLLATIRLQDGGAEVDAKHRQQLSLAVAILMGTHVDLYDVFLQECRQDGACYALVFHQVFEYCIVDGISYCHIVMVFESTGCKVTNNYPDCQAKGKEITFTAVRAAGRGGCCSSP